MLSFFQFKFRTILRDLDHVIKQLRLMRISFEQRSWLTFSSSSLLDKQEYCQRSHNLFLNVRLDIRTLPSGLPELIAG